MFGCVNWQNKAEAYNVLQNHRHTDNVYARCFELLQYGDDDRDNGGCQSRSAGEAHMHDNQEQCHDCEDHNGGGIGQVKGIDDNVGQPGSCFSGQQGIA